MTMVRSVDLRALSVTTGLVGTTDLDATLAAQISAGGARVFTTTPIPPYDVGDLWVQGASGDILTCSTAKTGSQSYNAADWKLASKYTDDTLAGQANQAAVTAQESAGTAQTAADNAKSLASTAQTTANLALQNSPELLANGGFETGDATGWFVDSTNQVVDDMASAHSGRYYLNAGSATEISQPISVPLISGHTYRFSGWYRRPSTNSSIIGGIRFQKSSDGNTYNDWQNTDFVKSEQADWTYFSIDGKIPSDGSAKYARYRLAFANTSGVVQHFDDLSFKDITEAAAAQSTADAAQTIATAAQSAASAAQSSANAAQDAANAAQTTADGKNKIVRSTSAPSSTSEYAAGDQWWVCSGSTVTALYLYSGTAWVSQTLTNSVIANLDAGKITTGYVDAARIAANSITADKLLVGGGGDYSPNPTFDPSGPLLGTPHWWIPGNGGHSVKLTGRDNFFPPSTAFPVTKGDTFYITCEAAHTAGTASLSLGLWWTVSPSTATSIRAYSNMQQATDLGQSANYPTWHTYAATISVPTASDAVVTAARGYIQMDVDFPDKETTAQNTWLIGNYHIYKVNDATLIADGAISTNKLVANAVTADKADIGSLTAAIVSSNQFKTPNNRVWINDQGISALNAVHSETFSVDSNTGLLTADSATLTNLNIANNAAGGIITLDSDASEISSSYSNVPNLAFKTSDGHTVLRLNPVEGIWFGAQQGSYGIAKNSMAGNAVAEYTVTFNKPYSILQHVNVAVSDPRLTICARNVSNTGFILSVRNNSNDVNSNYDSTAQWSTEGILL